MTDAGPRFLPGQAMGYGMTPGAHHNVMTGEDDPAPPKPYIPGPGYPQPEQMDLDAPEPSAQPSPAQPPAPSPFAGPMDPKRGAPVGWRVRDAAGNVVAELHNVNTRDYQGKQIEGVGQSLLGQAVTPEDKEAAARAAAYGRSLVGMMPAAEITKRMVQLYENDQRNGISRSIQEEKSKRAAMRGMGGGAPAGPSKADKFQVGLDKELRDTMHTVIESERKDTKHAALAQLDNDVSEMESLISAPGAMGQRIAVQKALLALTGKASRESEQSGLTGAAGKWEELKNKLSLWTSDDPQLGRKYIDEFRSMLRTQRQYIASQRQVMGKAAATRAQAETFGYPPEQRQMAYDLVYGAMTGQYTGKAASGPTGKVDDDLLK